MKVMAAAALACAGAFLGGCASVQMPPNVTIRPTDSHSGVVEAVDMSYTAQRPVDFGLLKQCVAENVSNDEVSLEGGARFGRNALGLIQSRNDSTVVQGGDLVKYADDGRHVMIVTGTAEAGHDPLGVIRYLLKFQLRVSAADRHAGLVFADIRQAQQNSGNMANIGFNPVGTWPGGRAMDVYGTLQALAERIKSCAG